MDSVVEVTSCSKDKEKNLFDRVLLWQITSLFTNHKWLIELDFEADKPKMKVELRVMMAEL